MRLYIGRRAPIIECSGTIVDFLDEFEPVFNNMCVHRNTLQKCRDSARDFEQNAVPGMVCLDTDWAENLTISKARLLQTQYYNLVQCSLLITVVQYLDKAAWEDSHSALKEGDEVTALGSGSEVPFYARVLGSEGDSYVLIRPDQSKVKRSRSLLKPRKWHRIAFIGFTNSPYIS